MQAVAAEVTATQAGHAATFTPSPYLTLAQVAQVRPFYTPAALRDLKFKSEDRLNSRGDRIPGNGSGRAGVWIQIGRKVLVDLTAFDAWIASHRRAA